MIFQGSYKSYIGAHRGASEYCPENTMSSFKRALEMKADMIEFDVQLSRDNKVVIFHDFYLKRITNKEGMVKDYTLKELQSFDVGSWFSEKYSFERIPTLEEMLQWAKNKVWLNIELKQLESEKDDLVKKVIEKLKSFQMIDQVQLMSSNHQSLAEVRSYSKRVITNVITSSRLVNPIKYLKELEAQVLNVPIINLSPALINKLHKEGLYVHGSFSNNVEHWKTLQEWGVNAMDTNIPDVMIRERLS